MSEAYATALAEYQQDVPFRPGTLCAYEIDVDDIVDLTDLSTLGALSVAPSDLACPWKRMALIEKATPPTWRLAESLRREGVRGARAPSVQGRDGVNIVLWRWNYGPGGRVVALDPLSDLPRDQSSWRET